jgi:hypothetical protein
VKLLPLEEGDEEGWMDNVRDLSWRLRCSLLLNARLQNWHLYFLSGASEAFREAGVDDAEAGRATTLAPGILTVYHAEMVLL